MKLKIYFPFFLVVSCALHAMHESEKFKNVFVVGHSGSGKSALINYLTQSEVCLTNANFRCTSEVQEVLFSYSDSLGREINLRFFDTPGFFDSEELFKNSSQDKIIKAISQNYLAAVIIVIHGFRIDTRMKKSMNYYKLLFEPLLEKEGCVIMVRSHLRSDDILEAQNTSDRIKFENNQFSKACLGTSEKVRFIWTNARINEINGRTPLLEETYFFDALKGNGQGEEKTYGNYCALTRQIILDSFYDAKAIDFSNYFYPLLPALAEKKEALIEMFFRLLAAEYSIVMLHDSDHAKLVADVISNLKAAHKELLALTELNKEVVPPNMIYADLIMQTQCAQKNAEEYLTNAKLARITLFNLQRARQDNIDSPALEIPSNALIDMDRLFILLADRFSIQEYSLIVDLLNKDFRP
jgi:GTP-binding protein EngB required for normal cell division